MRMFLALVFLSTSSAFANAATYTIQNWPQDLNKVPCDAWQRGSDGTWTEIGTIIVGGHTTSGMTFKDTDEAKILDDKCHH